MDIITNRMMRTSIPLFNTMASVVLVLALGTLLKVAKDPIIDLALAVILSFALAPVVRVLERHIGRGFAVLTALLATLSLVLMFIYLTYVQLMGLAIDLPRYEGVIRAKLSGLATSLQSGGPFSAAADALGRILADVEKLDGQAASTKAKTVVIENSGSALEPVLAVLEPISHPIITLVVVLLLTGFVLVSREDLRNRVIKLMGSDDIRVTTLALDDAGNRVGRMLLSQVALNAAFGTVIGVGLWLIGIPSPFLWGLFAGIMRFVPYVGAIIGLVPPLALAFAIDPTWATLLLTAGLFLVIEPIVGHVIEPMLYGHNTGVSPVAIVVLATLWAFLWGPIGLVLATPLTICLVVMGRHFPRLEFLQTLLGDKPALAPDESLYQNWLVGDAESAVLSTRNSDTQTSLVEYLDTVTLPAMRRANLDFVRGNLDTTMQDKLGLVSNRYVETLLQHDVRPRRSSWLALNRQKEIADAPISPAVKQGAEAVAAQDKFCAVVHGDQPLDQMMARLVGLTIEKFGIKTVILPLLEAQKMSADVTSGCWAVVMSFVEPSSTLHMRAYTRGAHRLVPGAPVLFAVWQNMEEDRLRSLRKITRAQGIVSSFADVSVIIARWLARESLKKRALND